MTAPSTATRPAPPAEPGVPPDVPAGSPARSGYGLWLLALAVLSWVVSLARIDEAGIGDLGLVDALPLTYFVALAVLTAGFCLALRAATRPPVLAAYVTVLVAMLHATPTIASDTLRYAWAWKHVGVVDYVQRSHEVWTDSPILTVYHNWPGFFGAVAALTDGAGFDSALSFASWAPLFFALVWAGALWALFSTFTTDRRVVALGVWFFVLANWVGQEYLAPQSFAYLLHLVVLVVVLTWWSRPGRLPARLERRLVRLRSGTVEPDAPAPVVLSGAQRLPVMLALVACMVAIATSHPLTPVVTTLALAALALAGALRARWLPLLMLGLTVVWMLTGAWRYVSGNLDDVFGGIGGVGPTYDARVVSFEAVDGAQRLVSYAGRAVVLAVVALAVAGFVRRARAGRVETVAALLMAAPVLLMFASAYGGEVVFRVYLFALPFAAYLSACAFLPRRDAPGWRPFVAVAVASVVLAAGFLLAAYGKEQWFRFTEDEVAASRAIYDDAPAGSLVVSGSFTYPQRFANYERFTYVSIIDEPRASVERLLADPVDVLTEWMSDPRFTRSYFVNTRSQGAEADALGLLPDGALDRVTAELVASGRFEVVVDNEDATVLSLTPEQEERP